MIFPLNAPMFDMIVLAIVVKDDAYGYQISQILKKVSNTKDSTLYPVLRRLEEHELLTAYDQQYQGRNRKYYRITTSGKTQYQNLLKEWDIYKEEIDTIVKGGEKHE